MFGALESFDEMHQWGITPEKSPGFSTRESRFEVPDIINNPSQKGASFAGDIDIEVPNVGFVGVVGYLSLLPLGESFSSLPMACSRTRNQLHPIFPPISAHPRTPDQVTTPYIRLSNCLCVTSEFSKFNTGSSE